MFTRMLVRAAMLRRGRAVAALFAMIVAAAVATAMMNLYVDVQAKLRTEFRNYGANVVVVPRLPGKMPHIITKAASTVSLCLPMPWPQSNRCSERRHWQFPSRMPSRALRTANPWSWSELISTARVSSITGGA